MRPSLPFRYRRFTFNPRCFPILLAALLALWGVTTAYAGWNTPLTLDSAGTVGHYTSLAVVNGNPAISYLDYSNYDLKYVRATNAAGSSWGSPVTVDSDGWVGEFISLAVVNGNPAISYVDLNGNLKYVRATNADGSSWGSPVTVNIASRADYTSLAVVNGNPAVSYRDSSNHHLKYVGATDADGSSWGSPVTIDSAGDVGDYTSLAVVNGNPAISYYDWTNGDLKYVRATNAAGSSWNTPLTLDSAGAVGWYTSLAVVNGNPAISYLHSSGYLKYVRATNADGSSWDTPLTLDSAGAVGWYTSLAVVNGNPAISYFDHSNYDLKYVRATNADGSSWGSPVTLDSAGAVGTYTSLAVVNGNPAISYYDWTNGDLKYVFYTPPAPEIAVLGNGTEITNGDATPSPTDQTDFGSVVIGRTLTRTFTISNSGDLDLNISGLSLSGAATADFTLSGLPTPALVGPGAATTFDVRFMPSMTGTRVATVTIANDDSNENPYDFAIRGTGTLPSVSLSVSAGSGTEAAQTVITVIATTSASVVGTQTVDLDVSGANITAGDYSLSNATITIPDGQSSGSVTFTIQNDFIDENDETATLTLSNPSVGITLGSPLSQDVTITDNDTASILVSPTSLSVTEPDGSGSFTVTLTSQPAATVTIGLVSGDPAQCAVSPAVLNLNGSNWSTGQTATVTAVDDGLVDGDQPCNVQTRPATSSDSSYHGLDSEDVTVTVIDIRRYVYLPLILRP